MLRTYTKFTKIKEPTLPHITAKYPKLKIPHIPTVKISQPKNVKISTPKMTNIGKFTKISIPKSPKISIMHKAIGAIKGGI